MIDLLIAFSVMSLVCVACGLTAGRFAYFAKGQRAMLLLAISVLAAILFLLYGSGRLFWARIVPSSAAIVYTNLAAVFAALATGWVIRLPDTPKWRRIGMAILLSLMSLALIFWPLLSIAVRPPPVGGNVWESGVALQTSWATCSPAAAATLLRAEGIKTSEAEMIPLCLTDAAGTPTLGLYRGLKLMAERHQRSVEVADCTTEELFSDNDWPALLAVELPYGVEDRRYVDSWGWIPGLGHSVVVLGRTADDRIIVADPSAGLEGWSEADLRLLWHGDAMRLK